MRPLIALFRKNLLDSRWTIAILGSSLFGLSWLFVYIASRIEARMKEVGGGGPMRMLRGLGGAAMDFSTAAIEMAFWNHPFVLLMFAIWGIARGSAAVAGEIEKGTMDLILSRPVGRSSFLLAQVASAGAGLAFMAAMLVVGNLVGSRYNALEDPPSAWIIARPGLNLLAFGWAIYGYTFFLSALDHARWRPNLIASVVTLAAFIAQVIANIPSLEEWKWLEKLSIFKAYNPVEVVTKGETLAFNAGLLGGIGTLGVVLGFLAFARRDLPAGS